MGKVWGSSMVPPVRTKASGWAEAFWLAAWAEGLSRMKEAAAMASRPKLFALSLLGGLLGSAESGGWLGLLDCSLLTPSCDKRSESQ